MEYLAAPVRRIFIIVLFFLGIFLPGIKTVSASDPPPARQTSIIVSFTEYEWWLVRWFDSATLCKLPIDHDGLPNSDDILNKCGLDIFFIWQSTPPCEPAYDGGFSTTSCKGLYLYFVGSKPSEKEVIVDLPVASAILTLEGCQPIVPENRCPLIPNLLITGEEPLPNEQILSIQGFYQGSPFSCDGAVCSLPLQASPMEGSEVEFWAVSSFGDTSQHYFAQVRVIDTGVSEDPGGGGWYVDVLSTQWRGEPLASCSQTWNAFQTPGGPPSWLGTPQNTDLLITDEAYFYLAGRLISNGVVDASACQTGGLLPNGYADACGLETARPYVQDWQNQFNARILEVSNDTGVPAQLMKNLFAQESQFWPGVFKAPYELGLGQLTGNGADAVLLWDDNFFSQFCPLVLSQAACDEGYLHLAPEDAAILRGALALEAKSDCPDCAAGIDLTDAAFSISLFANTIKANCDQVAQIVYNATKEIPGSVTSYEDLWRLVIANYHSGPGCVSYAVHMAWNTSGEITWAEVANNFTDPCKGVVPYVEKIAR